VDSIKASSPFVFPSNNTDKVLAVNSWGLQGRLSVRSSKESWLTKLEWTHDELTDDLTLSTSLGGGVAKLVYSDRGIFLTDVDGFMQKVSETELEALLGYSPPLSNLKYWVRGVPSPEQVTSLKAEFIDGVVAFKQDGWSVKLERFDQVGDVALPGRISLLKNDMRIKLVVDEWLS
jgi:outer membrane lipoprotein LolB